MADAKRMEKEIKVMIVDDSAFYRQRFSEMLKPRKHIRVLKTVSDGLEAIRFLSKNKPDVITLDLEMPRMDGFTFLRWLMANHPLPVVVVSSRGDKSDVFKALDIGAVDFVVKPTHRASLEVVKIQNELLLKVEAAAGVSREKIGAMDEIEPVKPLVLKAKKIPGPSTIEMITIGASTGGPPAIERILQRIPENLPLTITIAQHMPPLFTQYFAERLDKVTHLHVKEAKNNEDVRENTVYVAPGGRHMRLRRVGEKVYVTVEDHSEKDRYVPSVDVLMKSAAQAYGPRVMGILLTGMGKDGKEGMGHIKKSGGQTVAEAEQTAVVFGMPKEAINEGVVDTVSCLYDIPNEIIKRFT